MCFNYFKFPEKSVKYLNKYKKLAANTAVFAIGSFGSKILLLLLTRLYTHNISTGDNSTKSLLEQTANFIIPIATFSIAEAVIRYGLDRDYDNRKFSYWLVWQYLHGNEENNAEFLDKFNCHLYESGIDREFRTFC